VVRAAPEPEVEQRSLDVYDALAGGDGRGCVMAGQPAAARKARDPEAEMAFLTRALKAPTLRELVTRRPAIGFLRE
jgi:hypothetical protein